MLEKNDNISKESPSVLKYLNEQMPKVNNIFQEQNQEEKYKYQSSKALLKQLEKDILKKKSVLDNISKTVKAR